jgi:amino acid adenylation domain-containing protein
MLTDSQRAALAAHLRKGRENTVAKIPRRPAGLTDLPMSYGQEQLWFIDRLAPGLPTYNILFALKLTGPLDAEAMCRAVDKLVARHEALRTRLVANGEGRPVQRVDPPKSQILQLRDLAGMPPDERQASLRDFLDTEARRPFKLAEGPLLRNWLLKLADREHMFLTAVHHSVFDGWSIGVLVKDVAALYAAEATGEPPALAELPVQFADYALWERDRLEGAALDELEAYWRGVLTGFETVQFPTDRPRPVLDTFNGALARHHVDLDLLEGLRELSRQQGTTLFVVLIATLQALLSRFTGQTDLVLGTASANRSRRELAPLIAFLVNTLPVRADLSGDPPFTELLARTAKATTGAYAHQDLPFAKLVETLKVERDPSRAPVFQMAMSFVERDDAPLHAAGIEFGVFGDDLVSDFNAAKFDMDFGVGVRKDGLYFEVAYKTGLFDPATLQRLLGSYEVLLRGVVADPSTRLSQLPLLTADELHRELKEWNDTAAEFPQLCIHQGVEAQVARTPGLVAAEYQDQQLSYAELNQQANQIARRLRAAGVGPETLVGVCMQTGLRRLAGLLGIWKAGGGYVPLDSALPADRLSFMITDTGMSVVLTDGPSAASVPAVDGVTVISLDDEWDQICALDGADLTGTGADTSSVAYVIYTSGSTGEPKGVVVEHRQAFNFLHGMVEHWKVGPSDAVLQFAAFTFDVSVMDMFMPLLGGAKVVLAAAETLHSPPRLAALIREAGVTFACLPPAVLNLLIGEDFPGLRTLLSAGEELTSDLLRAWLRDGLEIYNGYGPTEAAMGATFMRLDESVPLPPPIGRPKPNYRVYVLDPQLNPVPVGVIGELHIGGAGVARGYLNRPELTRDRFIGDPFTPGQRLYKTGDLVRRRPDGTIVFIGRMDDQVKIRGLRVELGEIEAAMTAHPGVAQAVVTVVTDAAGEKQLAGYLRPVPASAPDLSEVRQRLALNLPAYMVPTFLTMVDEFPLTANGKIDKAALPEPQAQAAAAGQVPPATLIEAMMTDIFASLLGIDQVGATDSFFDLGGNSLQAMRLISVIDDEIEVDIGAVAVFLAPTPRQLAALLRDKHGLDDASLDEESIEELAEAPDGQTALAPAAGA